jgi:RNA ligase
MNYQFPPIRTIDDVLPSIKGADEFVVSHRDDYIVVNYTHVTPETFPSVWELKDYNTKSYNHHAAVRRECRGIVFDRDGKIISRRLHKFFNVNEKPETQLPYIRNYLYTLEKLDGSMITPIGSRLGTKMGITDVSLLAEEFVKDKSNYSNFIEYCDKIHATPTFELCTDKNRIVISHPVDRLVLIAIRDNISGVYTPYTKLQQLAKDFSIDLVKRYSNKESAEELVERVRHEEEGEGYVLVFDNHHLVKIKTDLYVKIHSIKDQLLTERNLVSLLLAGKLDDAKSLLDDEWIDKLNKYEHDFWIKFNSYVKEIEEVVSNVHDRKTFALEVAPSLNQRLLPVYYASIGKIETVRDNLIQMIDRNCISNKKFTEVVKPLLDS